jgi:hypothetical protein
MSRECRSTGNHGVNDVREKTKTRGNIHVRVNY